MKLMEYNPDLSPKDNQGRLVCFPITLCVESVVTNGILFKQGSLHSGSGQHIELSNLIAVWD